MKTVKLVSITPEVENTISYCARVSNPKNQDNYDTAPKLLKYCIKNGHWSPFELGNMVVEIVTGRDVAPQILRHRSFSFQEFSQRYAQATGFVKRFARRQDLKNRQNSTDDISENDKLWFEVAQDAVWQKSYSLYEEAISKGIAKECARALLPLNTQTTLYMNGTIRSWIHYCVLRCDKATQIEHREIANQCYNLLKQHVPNICEALEELHPFLKEVPVFTQAEEKEINRIMEENRELMDDLIKAGD